MKVSVKNLDGLNFELSNGKSSIEIDPKEFSPVEVFSSAMTACSGVDIVQLSNRNNTPVSNLKIDTEIKRAEGYPQIIKEAVFIYSFDSEVDDVTAKRWVLSSLETYCSTINSIRSTAKLFYTINHNSNTIAYKESIVSGNGEGHQMESFDDDFEGMGCTCCH
jgi:putative redox protein